jgi:hypothetical protein
MRDFRDGVQQWELDMVRGQVRKHLGWDVGTLVTSESYEEENTLYYETAVQGEPTELKVWHDKEGHFTNFRVEFREQGAEDWRYADSWEEWI